LTPETIYLETSVISYLAARPSRDLLVAGQQQVTWDWWDKEKDRYRLFISEAVLDEASLGDPDAAARRLALIAGLSELALNVEVRMLSKALVAQKAVPEKAITDAVHIAVAAVHGANYLLTWNCKHINNAHTRKAISGVCLAHGLEAPTICTPQEIMEGG
jgi:predicted nucleic acid-binding protein